MESTEELLGSLTTYNGVQTGESIGQTVRTSARVIKKMRQDSTQQSGAVLNIQPQDVIEKDKKEVKIDGIDKLEKENGILSANVDCNVSNKASSSVAKQRMPKALWSTSEKTLFFEALNEHGKDFDSITAYICNKVKKKGVPDTMTKNKHQVSHFYYRTWQKVSKYVKFGDDVKKVVQELYTLINYGEMRKRLVSGVVARTLPRLSELVWNGVVAVRAGGRTVRVRTPVCRALRRLNRLEEWEEQLKLPTRVAIMLCPRDMEAWSRIHAAAHNPRVLIPTAPSRRLGPVLSFLQRRWLNPTDSIRESLLASVDGKPADSFNLLEMQINSLLNPNNQTLLNVNKSNLPLNPLNVETLIDVKVDENVCVDDNVQKNVAKSATAIAKIEEDEVIADEIKDILSKNLIHVEDVNKTYEKEVRLEDADLNIQNKKNEDDENDQKNIKWLISNDAKDLVLHIGPKPGVDFNIPTVNVSEHITSQRICYNVYQERLGTVVQTNGSNCNNVQSKVGGRFKSHKRQRKDSGEADPNAVKKTKPSSDYLDKNDHFNVFDVDETANDGMNGAFADIRSNSLPKDVMSDEKSNDENNFNDYRDKELYSEQEDEDKYNNETDGESDIAGNKLTKENMDRHKKHLKLVQVTNLKVKIKTKKDREGVTVDNVDDKLPPTFSTFFKKNWNKDILMQQVRKGWSIYDVGDLTVGDLYLMFGNESKLELNYWWAKPTLPFSNEVIRQMQKGNDNPPIIVDMKENETIIPISANIEEPKLIEKRKLSEQERLLLSPNHSNSMESIENDDLKKDFDISPDYKSSRSDEHLKIDSFNIVSKIINNPLTENSNKSQTGAEQKFTNKPFVVSPRDRIITITTRLKKLLSLSQLHIGKGRMSCPCGHVCSVTRGKKTNNLNEYPTSLSAEATAGKVSTKANLKPKANTSAKNNLVLKADNIFNQNSLIKNISKPTHHTMILPTNNETAGKEFNLPNVQVPRHLLVNVNQDPLTSKQQENIVQNSNDPQLLKTDKFQPPYASKEIFSKPPQYTNNKIVDFSDLPRWTKRTGRSVKQNVVVRKLLPIAPWPPLENNIIGTLIPVTVPSTVARLPQLRPAPPKKWFPPEEKIKPKVSAEIVPAHNYFEGSNNNGTHVEDPTPPIATVNVEKTQDNMFAINPDVDVVNSWHAKNGERKDLITDGSSNLSNLLDISLPSNIVDENSLEVPILKLKHSNDNNGKHDDFAGLLHTESMSLSPSRLLKENESNWLGSDVHDFSLSSFLGHLESTPTLKSEEDSLKKATIDILEKNGGDLNNSSRGTNETVENQLHCLMSETSIDYMAKFADLAAQVNADNMK